MALGVNARTAFSLLFPPILDEFGWPRGLTAGAFSFGFLVSAFLSPVLGRGQHPSNVVDHDWASVDWTLARAMRTARFWWVVVGFVGGLFAWYAVQVHQTKYLIEIGFTPARAAGALGLVGFTGIVGQIALGHLSDRVGREWVWTLACVGFALSYAL